MLMGTMSKVTLGVLMFLPALILLSRGLVGIGIIAFVFGILLMNGWK